MGEVLPQEGLDDLVAAPLPAGQVLQALSDRGVAQPWHGSSFPGGAVVCTRRHGGEQQIAHPPPSQAAAAGAIPSAGAGRWPARVTPRSMNAYQWAVERIPSPLTVASDLGKRRSAQRLALDT